MAVFRFTGDAVTVWLGRARTIRAGALIAAEPDLKGQINRYGSRADGARIAVAPYMEYSDPRDLTVFDRCATDRRIPAERYAACFALPLNGDRGPSGRPLAMRPR